MPSSLLLQALPDAPLIGLPADVLPLVAHLIGALAILLVGWIGGGLLARLVRSLLRRFSLGSPPPCPLVPCRHPASVSIGCWPPLCSGS
jgi:hypothetical protein